MHTRKRGLAGTRCYKVETPYYIIGDVWHISSKELEIVPAIHLSANPFATPNQHPEKRANLLPGADRIMKEKAKQLPLLLAKYRRNSY